MKLESIPLLQVQRDLSSARPWGRALLAIFLFALLARIDFGQQIRHLPTQGQLVMDAARYDAWAREIAGGQWRPREVFSQAPLYPYLVAGVYAVTDGSRAAVRFLQALLGAATAVLLAMVARRLFGNGAGLAAGGLAALYGPAIFYTPLLLKTTCHLFLQAAVLVLLVPPAGRSLGLKRSLVAGACLGLAALLQENLLALAPFLLAGVYWRSAGDRRRRALAGGAFALGTALALAPVVALNYAAGGELVLTSAQSGMNFYIGNARGASGTYVPLSSGSQDPAHQKADAARIAAGFAARGERTAGASGELSAREVSSIFWQETARQIAAAPASWLRLVLWKLRLFWNAYEIPDAQGYDVYRREVGFRPWVGFGLVAALFFAGLAAVFRGGEPRQRRDAWGLALLAGVCCLSVVAFFVFGRYRLIVFPFLVPLAGFAMARLVELAGQRDWRELTAVGGVALSMGILIFVPAYSPEETGRLEAAIYYNLGTAANRGSIVEFHAARAAASREEASQRLGTALDLARRSAGYLDEAIRRSPDFFNARLERAWARFRYGGYQAAGGKFEEAAKAYAQARDELSRALALGAAGAPPEATAEAKRLLEEVERAARSAAVARFR